MFLNASALRLKPTVGMPLLRVAANLSGGGRNAAAWVDETVGGTSVSLISTSEASHGDTTLTQALKRAPEIRRAVARRIRVTRVSKRKATTAVSGSGKLLAHRLVGVWSPIATRLLPGILRSCRGCIQGRPTRHRSRCPSAGSRPADRRRSWCHRTRRCSKGFCADSVPAGQRPEESG